MCCRPIVAPCSVIPLYIQIITLHKNENAYYLKTKVEIDFKYEDRGSKNIVSL